MKMRMIMSLTAPACLKTALCQCDESVDAFGRCDVSGRSQHETDRCTMSICKRHWIRREKLPNAGNTRYLKQITTCNRSLHNETPEKRLRDVKQIRAWSRSLQWLGRIHHILGLVRVYCKNADVNSRIAINKFLILFFWGTVCLSVCPHHLSIYFDNAGHRKNHICFGRACSWQGLW